MDIHSLENESILQLYINAELSEVDSAELEAQLRADPSLRAQLQELQSLQDEAHASLARLDVLDPIVPSEISQRTLMRQLRQQMVEIAARPKPAVKVHRVSRLAWTGIVAAAAVVIFCLSILNSSVRDTLAPRPNLVSPDSVVTGDQPTPPAPSEESVRPSAVALVSVDQSSQKLEVLESLVHDDLRDAWH